MKIAVTYENGQVFQHFGHAEHFKIYDVVDGKAGSTSMLDTDGNGHGALAGILKNAGVDTLICGGIGAGAKNMLADENIQLYGGVTGEADKAVADFLNGKLQYNPAVSCTHHEEEHGAGGTCGEHSC